MVIHYLEELWDSFDEMKNPDHTWKDHYVTWRIPIHFICAMTPQLKIVAGQGVMKAFYDRAGPDVFLTLAYWIPQCWLFITMAYYFYASGFWFGYGTIGSIRRQFMLMHTQAWRMMIMGGVVCHGGLAIIAIVYLNATDNGFRDAKEAKTGAMGGIMFFVFWLACFHKNRDLIKMSAIADDVEFNMCTCRTSDQDFYLLVQAALIFELCHDKELFVRYGINDDELALFMRALGDKDAAELTAAALAADTVGGATDVWDDFSMGGESKPEQSA